MYIKEERVRYWIFFNWNALPDELELERLVAVPDAPIVHSGTKTAPVTRYKIHWNLFASNDLKQRMNIQEWMLKHWNWLFYLTCVATALMVDTVTGFALVTTPPSGDVLERVAASAFCPLWYQRSSAYYKMRKLEGKLRGPSKRTYLCCLIGNVAGSRASGEGANKNQRISLHFLPNRSA